MEILHSLLGMAVLIVIAIALSKHRSKINKRTVGVAFAIQFALGAFVLYVPWGRAALEWFSNGVQSVLNFGQKGTEFVFGGLVGDKMFEVFGGGGFVFAFRVLPMIIFFSSLISVLYYLGVMSFVVKVLGGALQKALGTSRTESLSAAANVFVGQTEAPLMIKSYLEKMTKSEILLVMVGGMATVAGGVLASYINFLGGNDPVMKLEFAKHLLAASVMAAPGAVVISKMLYPQEEVIPTMYETSSEKFGSNVLDVISTGTSEGLKLAANVGAMLLVFVALIAMINYFLGWVGDITYLNPIIKDSSVLPYDRFSLEMILGSIFSPIMWLIGVAKEDMMLVGQLLGIKLAASEFVGYTQLATLKNPETPIHLMYQKSVIMSTYLLCGFANFASIGIQIGGIGSLAPGQRKTLSEFGLKAVLGGTLASLMSATIAGMILG